MRYVYTFVLITHTPTPERTNWLEKQASIRFIDINYGKKDERKAN